MVNGEQRGQAVIQGNRNLPQVVKAQLGIPAASLGAPVHRFQMPAIPKRLAHDYHAERMRSL